MFKKILGVVLYVSFLLGAIALHLEVKKNRAVLHQRQAAIDLLVHEIPISTLCQSEQQKISIVLPDLKADVRCNAVFDERATERRLHVLTVIFYANPQDQESGERPLVIAVWGHGQTHFFR